MEDKIMGFDNTEKKDWNYRGHDESINTKENVTEYEMLCFCESLGFIEYWPANTAPTSRQTQSAPTSKDGSHPTY